MRRLIEDLQEAMTLRDVAQKHAPEELAQHGADEKMVFGKWVKTSKGMRKRIKRQAAAEKPKFKVMRSPKGILVKVPAAQRHSSKGLARAFGESQDYAGMRAMIEAEGNKWGGRMGPADKAWVLTAADAKALNAMRKFHGHVAAGDNWMAEWSPKAQGAALVALKALRAGDLETAEEQVVAAQRIEGA
jgi:hypothetical protein